MYLSTLNDIKDRKYEVLGVVRCNYGACENFLDVLMECLIDQAIDFDADGILGITFSSTGIWEDSSMYDDQGCYQGGGKYPEMFAYGTAIKFKD